jgi:MFS family permease
MPDSARSPDHENVAIDVSRRSACAILGLGAMLLGQRAFATDKGIELALAEQYGLMRRAYQTGNAELLRQFYSNDVVLAAERASPVVGLDVTDAVAPSWHALLTARALEGFALGGVPAVAMAYLAEEIHPQDLGLSMGLYVGGSAFGATLLAVAWAAAQWVHCSTRCSGDQADRRASL